MSEDVLSDTEAPAQNDIEPEADPVTPQDGQSAVPADITEAISAGIVQTFAFAKAADHLAEIWDRRLTLADGGCLVPLTRLQLQDPQVLERLTRWRKTNHDSQLDAYGTSEAETQKWLEKTYLQDPERLMMMIYDDVGRLVGHIGLALVAAPQPYVCLEHCVRGEAFARQGILSDAILGLATWARTGLLADEVRLRVLASNVHMLRFAERMGWQEVERTPLHEQDGSNGRHLGPGADEDAEDHLLTLARPDPVETPKEMILTAGPSIGLHEPCYVSDAVRTGWNANWAGYITQFEQAFQDYVGVPHALATSSCTGALHIALLALDIGPGDEVIVPDITWVATAQVVRQVGATPVFADIDRETWCLDVKSAADLVTDKTKAIMPVHLYGHPCDMDAVMALADKHDLYVIEDAAPSIGAEYKGRRTGSFGHFAAFSFQGAKLAVTGEGGMLLCRDAELFAKARQIWDQGRKPGTFWIERDGVKYKMSNVQAALGLGQLQRNDAMVAAKRRIYHWYQEGLEGVAGVRLNGEAPWARSICWMTSIWLDEAFPLGRDEMIAELKARKIDSRPVFPPISQYPIWEQELTPKPMAQAIGDRAINLPSGVCLPKAHVQYVCQQIREISERGR